MRGVFALDPLRAEELRGTNVASLQGTTTLDGGTTFNLMADYRAVPLLMLAVLSVGITASTFDVAINSSATEREKRTGKSELSKLHGLGCAGGLAGATLGRELEDVEGVLHRHAQHAD